MVFSLTLGITLGVQTVSDGNQAKNGKVLSQLHVKYSDPSIDTGYSANAQFKPKGMQHVYTITHAFLDLVQRKEVLPVSINLTEILSEDFWSSPQNIKAKQLHQEFSEHWEELILQYIGVITCAICGILAAIAVPFAGFCVCCCRCAGKCGGYPEHFDKRGDACRRVSLGILLSTFTVAAMFGVVSAFVTNQYSHDGVTRLPDRLQDVTDDSSLYLDNTGIEIHNLLVTNFEELEKVLNQTLDEGGPILKRKLAHITNAVAIDNITDIVSRLGNVRSHLKEINKITNVLQVNVKQLKQGLEDRRTKLKRALRLCNSNKACQNFLKEYTIDKDLAVAANFENLPFELPDVNLLMRDINELLNNNIMEKVEVGKEQLDNVKIAIENSIVGIRPKIKKEIRTMGRQLSDKAADIQRVLNEFDSTMGRINREIPKVKPDLNEYSNYIYYIGLGMSCLVLLILCCYVFGLFYGFCGKRPGNVYGDDCCNRGTGANWLLAAVYLTFLFSIVLLSVTTIQFLIGSTADKVACNSLMNPNDSEIFQLLDKKVIQPLMQNQFEHQASEKTRDRVSSPIETALKDMSLTEVINSCHQNETMYKILRMDSIYNVEELRDWKTTYNVGSYLSNLKNKIRSDDINNIQILSPQAQRNLEELAQSQISDLNFTQYTHLIQEQITSIELGSFTARLNQIRDRLPPGSQASTLIANEALYLKGMEALVVEMKLATKQLQSKILELEKDATFDQSTMREALGALIQQASKATRELKQGGTELIDTLANRYVNETVGLIDAYVERVINYTTNYVGKCHPISRSYNATVVALCREVVDPFNGFWASIGWCYLFYLPSIALAISLISLYRKSEEYPGPLVDPHQSDELVTGAVRHAGGKKSKRARGHRRNPSEYLPDSAHHYRAGYSYQADHNRSSLDRFQDVAPRNYGGSMTSSVQAPAPIVAPVATQSVASSANQPPGGPPRYTSNPNVNLDNAEYERPPPYYYPGAATSQAPPALPAPNRP